jgi:hypothetical protein
VGRGPVPPRAPQGESATSPVTPAVASDLYGHLAEVDAQADGQKQTIAQNLQVQEQEVGAQAAHATSEEQARIVERSDAQKVGPVGPGPTAPPKEAKVEGPPTKEGLEAELTASLEQELTELDAGRDEALADLDGRIAEQQALVDGAVLDSNATTSAEQSLGEQATGQQAAIQKKTGGRAANLSKEARDQAESEAGKVESEAGTAAGKMRSDGAAEAGRIRGTTMTQFNAATAQAGQQMASMVDDGVPAQTAHAVFVGLLARAEKVKADGEARARNAELTAGKQADDHLAEARRQARKIRDGAASYGEKLAVGNAPAIEEERKAGAEKLEGTAEDARKRQRDKAAATLADLKRQRTTIADRIEAQVSAKKKAIEARVGALRKQLASADAGAVAGLATSVRKATEQIDQSSDQLEISSRREVEAAGQRFQAQAAQTIAVMQAQGRAAMAQIDAQARAARTAIERAGSQASTQAEAQLDADAAARRRTSRRPSTERATP